MLSSEYKYFTCIPSRDHSLCRTQYNAILESEIRGDIEAWGEKGKKKIVKETRASHQKFQKFNSPNVQAI